MALLCCLLQQWKASSLKLRVMVGVLDDQERGLAGTFSESLRVWPAVRVDDLLEPGGSLSVAICGGSKVLTPLLLRHRTDIGRAGGLISCRHRQQFLANLLLDGY